MKGKGKRKYKSIYKKGRPIQKTKYKNPFLSDMRGVFAIG